MVPKYILAKLILGELPDVERMTFVIAKRQDDGNQPFPIDLQQNPWTQSRSKMLYDCLLSGEQPSGPMPDHKRHTDLWWNKGSGKSIKQNVFMDKLQYEKWVLTIQQHRFKESDWEGIRHCGVNQVSWNRKRLSAPVRLGQDGKLWCHDIKRTDELDEEIMSGEALYRNYYKYDYGDKKFQIMYLNDLYHHYNFAFMMQADEFCQWTKRNVLEKSVPTWVKIFQSQDRRIAYKKVSPWIYSQRVIPAQPSTLLAHQSVPPVLFTKQENEPCLVDDIIHSLFFSEETIVTKEMLQASSNETLQFIGKTKSFWKTKKRRRGRGAARDTDLSCKDVIKLLLFDTKNRIPVNEEILPTNGGAGYAKIYDSSTGELYPIFRDLLDIYLEKTSQESHNMSLEEFTTQLKSLVDEIQVNTAKARELKGHPSGKPKCHKVYAIVYYGLNADQSVHIDILEDQYMAVRACQPDTKPTAVIETKSQFYARNFKELVDANRIQCKFLQDSDPIFPDLQVALNSLTSEAKNTHQPVLFQNSQVLQLPFCYTLQHPLVYEKAKEPTHLQKAQFIKKTTPNDKRTILEREQGVQLTPKIPESVSIRKAIKEAAKERYTNDSYRMERGDTIIMSGGIPHYGPAETQKVKLFFDLTIEKNGQTTEPYDHKDQIDILVLYVAVCEYLWNHFEPLNKEQGRNNIIRWLIGAYVIRLCQHHDTYTKFESYALLFRELMFIETEALKYCKDNNIQIPKQATELFDRLESGNYTMKDDIRNLCQHLFDQAKERAWWNCDSLFTRDATVLRGPVFHIDHRTQRLVMNRKQFQYLSRDINPLQFLVEHKKNPTSTKPLNQFAIAFQKDRQKFISNTEIYQVDPSTAQGRDENTQLSFPTYNKKEQEGFVYDHLRAVFAVVNNSPNGETIDGLLNRDDLPSMNLNLDDDNSSDESESDDDELDLDGEQDPDQDEGDEDGRALSPGDFAESLFRQKDSLNRVRRELFNGRE
jgi:hypothetical protein